MGRHGALEGRHATAAGSTQALHGLRARALLLSALALTTPATGGCTLIGLGLGSATPKYETVSPPYASLEPGAEVRVEPKTAEGRERAGNREHLYGTYAGARDGVFEIDTKTGTWSFRQGDVAAVSKREGSYWLAGLLVGAGIDVTLIIASAIAISHSMHTMNISIGRLD